MYCINTVDRKLEKNKKKSAGKGTKKSVPPSVETFAPLTEEKPASRPPQVQDFLICNVLIPTCYRYLITYLFEGHKTVINWQTGSVIQDHGYSVGRWDGSGSDPGGV